MLTSLLHVAATSVLTVPVAQDKPPGATANVVKKADLGLTLELGFLQDFRPDPDPEAPKGWAWVATLEGSSVRVELATFDLGKSLWHEPEDAIEYARDALMEERTTRGFEFEPVRAVRGAFGSAPILAITRSDVTGAGGEAEAEVHLLGSLIGARAWYLQVDVAPVLGAEPRARLTRALEGCAKWSGKARDPKWTDAEAKACFDALAPEDARKKYGKPLRTEHFIVLSPHSSANQYGKKLEAWYAEIRKVLPFEEAKDRRLMPVLLFRHDEEFRQFMADLEGEKRAAIEYESWCDGAWYATHFDNDSEYDNRMELTKFLLINRMRAWGACNWFRNGLREYCATRANEREEAVRAVKKKRATPLEKLFDDRSWGARARRMDKTGADAEADYWLQSAVWMEFLREGQQTKGKFTAFMTAMSAIADGDVERVKSTLKATFGWDVPELEERMADYCQARK